MASHLIKSFEIDNYRHVLGNKRSLRNIQVAGWPEKQGLLSILLPLVIYKKGNALIEKL